MLSVQDGIGTVWRGQVMVSCSALGGLRLALPLLAPLYALGGFKLPFTMIWTFWIGWTLVHDPMLDGR